MKKGTEIWTLASVGPRLKKKFNLESETRSQNCKKPVGLEQGGRNLNHF